jgi:enoyl-CoA hydratase/carnithine racemase
MNEFVVSELKNNIAEITFGTPKSNSLPGAILEKLAQTILDEGAKEEVKAILVKSEGEKAFVQEQVSMNFWKLKNWKNQQNFSEVLPKF